jgi:hypothetical protein
MATEITLRDHFARLAKHFRAKANNEADRLKADWAHLADCYEELTAETEHAALEYAHTRDQAK